jgi:beta-glucosidase
MNSGLLLGVASSAAQMEDIEHGQSLNEKALYESEYTTAGDRFDRWREDADLLIAMGIRIYRAGVEWARLCPAEHEIDEGVLARYREEFSYLRENGVSVLLTIHAFSNPLWFDQKGGFQKAENIEDYLSYVELVVRSFGDIVSRYITMSEPNVYAVQTFYSGHRAFAKKTKAKLFQVMSVLAACHIRAYQRIHQLRGEMGYGATMVSFAHHMRVFVPENPNNPTHRLYVRLLKIFFQEALIHAMYFGTYKWPLNNVCKAQSGEYCDFIALNYFTRTTVSGLRDGTREKVSINDLGWEIYPKGIVKCAARLYDLIKKPIYITGNGTCDNNDAFRCRFLYDHLKALCASGLPVERYYHWAFLDPIRRGTGEIRRFGLIHVDADTRERTVKRSGAFYAEVIRSGGVTQRLYDQYVKDQDYHI